MKANEKQALVALYKAWQGTDHDGDRGVAYRNAGNTLEALLAGLRVIDPDEYLARIEAEEFPAEPQGAPPHRAVPDGSVYAREVEPEGAPTCRHDSTACRDCGERFEAKGAPTNPEQET